MSQTTELANKIATRDEDQRPTMSQLIEKQKVEIARALPNNMTPERFTRLVLTTFKATPALQKCTPHSFIAACMLSAQLGLEPGPLGHAYFVPYNNKGVDEVQFIIGYKGIIDLARRSGNIVSIEAREVCENDEFEFAYGLEPKLHHKPNLEGRGQLIAVYGIAHYVGGGYSMLVMSKEDVDKHRARSKSATSSHSPWKTDYEAMARKTVIRAMAAFLPLSVETASAVAQDGTVRHEIEPNMADAPPAAEDDEEVVDAEVIPDGDLV